MGNEINHVNASNILQAKKVNCLTLLLTKDRNHNIGTDDFAMISRIYLKYSALQYSLKAMCWLSFLL